MSTTTLRPTVEQLRSMVGRRVIVLYNNGTAVVSFGNAGNVRLDKATTRGLAFSRVTSDGETYGATHTVPLAAVRNVTPIGAVR